VKRKRDGVRWRDKTTIIVLIQLFHIPLAVVLLLLSLTIPKGEDLERAPRVEEGGEGLEYRLK